MKNQLSTTFFTLIHTGKLFKKMRISNNMTEEPLAREMASVRAPPSSREPHPDEQD